MIWKFLLFGLWLVVCAGLLVGQAVFAESPFAATTDVTVDFDTLPQGTIGTIEISGVGVSRVRAAFLDHQYTFISDIDGNYRGFITTPIDAKTGTYRLSILVFYEDNTQAYFWQDVRVTSGIFVYQEFTLPTTISDLGDEETALDELAILQPYIDSVSEGDKWKETGFLQPFESYRISSGFGGYRRFDGGTWQRHTGIDYPAPVGTPANVVADGRVVYVGTLPIRGNYILVDHGLGVFTGYAHLSKVVVEAGETVEQGEMIGEVGNTGRSTGAHLHWEVAIGGVWVEPVTFATLIEPNTE